MPINKHLLDGVVMPPIPTLIFKKKVGDALVSSRDSQGWTTRDSWDRILVFRSQCNPNVWLDYDSYRAERRRILSEHSVFQTRRGYRPAQGVPSSIGYRSTSPLSHHRIPVVFVGGRWISLRIPS